MEYTVTELHKRLIENKKNSLSEIIFDLYLKFYLVTSLFFFLPGQLYVPQEMFIQYSAIFFFALSFFVPRKRDISNFYLTLFLGYSLIHTIFFSFQPESRLTLNNLFLGLVTLKILAERIDFDFKKMGSLYLIFIAMNLFLMSLQIINRDPIYTSVNFDKMSQIDVVGFMGIRFCLGVLAALSLPFIFAYNPWCSLSLLPFLYYSKSSTAVLATVITFLFLMWFKNRKLFFIFSGILLAASIYYVGWFDGPNGQFVKRLNVWWAGLAILKERVWFGYGLGKWATINFISIQGNGQPEKWQWAHNEWLQYLFEQGLVGSMILYAYFKRIWKYISFDETGKIVFSLLLALMIVSFFHFPFHIGRFVGIGIYILALVEAYISEKIEKNNISDTI